MTVLGTVPCAFDVHIRRRRTGWRRFRRGRRYRIGTVHLALPVHARADDDGDVRVTPPELAELARALAAGLRDLADHADHADDDADHAGEWADEPSKGA